MSDEVKPTGDEPLDFDGDDAVAEFIRASKAGAVVEETPEEPAAPVEEKPDAPVETPAEEKPEASADEADGDTEVVLTKADLEAMFGLQEEGDNAQEVAEPEPAKAEEPAPKAEPPAPAAVKPLGMPELPAFDVSEADFDTMFQSRETFVKTISDYGKSVAATTMQHVLQNMVPHIHAHAMMAVQAADWAQKTFEKHPELELFARKFPGKFAQVTAAVRAENPALPADEFTAAVVGKIGKALEVLKQLANAKPGSRLDLRKAGTRPAVASGARNRPATKEETPTLTPTEAFVERMEKALRSGAA